ncbi:MAG: PKD domain-containing protein [Bacteroidia bacterium]
MSGVGGRFFFAVLAALYLTLHAAVVSAQCPGLDFTASKQRACLFDAIYFYPENLPSGSQVNWVIDGDTSLTVDTLFWISNKTGTFDVELLVMNGSQTCSVIKGNFITIGAPASNPPINVSSLTVCDLDDTLSISNNTPIAMQHSWSIGSQYYPDTSATINHVFGKEGYFRINLKVVDSNGCEALNSLDSILVVKAPELNIQASPTAFCAGDSVNFSFTAAPPQSVSSILWTFDGAIPGTSANAAPSGIAYSSPGSYDVKLEITTAVGCSYHLKEDSLINSGTKHSLSLQLSSHYVCTETKFTAQTAINSLDPDNFSWILAGATVDGASEADSQIVSYEDAGKKTVRLKYNDNGCISDAVDTVQVVNLAPNFTADKTCGCKVPLNVNFNSGNTSYSGPGTPSYAWTFYNGSGSAAGSSNQRNPSFNYTQSGKHDVELTVSDGNGCVKSNKKKGFIRLEPLKATVAASPKIVCPGQQVVFSTKTDSTCQDGLTVYSWRFYDLDGVTLLSTSSAARPSLSYSSVGDYDVSLAITNQDGCSDSVKVHSVVTVDHLQVNFEADDTVLCNGRNTRIRIINTTGISASVNWTITETATGNVLLNTTAASPKVTFPDPGIYSVKLIAQAGGACADTVIRNSYIQVNGISTNITANDTGGCPPFSTALQGNVTNHNISGDAGNVTVNWIRPSNNSPLTYSSSTAENTTVNIASKGCYDVELKVTNAGGCSFTDFRKDFLCAGVVADFDAPVRGCLHEKVALSNTSSVNAKSYKWFSSRSQGYFLPSDTASDPEFYATDDGTFQISLIATDTFGCADTTTKGIDIDHFAADFSTPDTAGQCSPAFIDFEISALNADSFFWDFGDGQRLVSIQKIASNLYDLQNADSLNNFYDVTLIAKSINGCYDTMVKPQFVNIIGPFLKFTYLNNTGCEPLEVQFVDANESVLSFLFDYGDNSPLSSNRVSGHTYMARPNDTLTIYRPTVIATDNKGCIRQFTPDDSIVVYKEPVAAFRISDTQGCEPFQIQFTSTSSFASKFYWDFNNDGITDDTTENPEYSFDAGVYSVKLVAESPYGCLDTMLIPQLITVYENPEAKMDFDTTVVCFLAEVYFYDLSSGPAPLIKRWWDFGDTSRTADTSSQTNPFYVYQSPGFYSTSLIVEDINGCRDTQIFNYVEVVDTAPLAYSGLKFVTVNADNEVELEWNNDNIRGFKHYLVHRQEPTGFVIFDTIQQETITQLTDTVPQPQDGSQCYDLQVQINCLTKSLLDQEHCTIWLQTRKGAEREIILDWTPYQGWTQVLEYDIFRSDGAEFAQIATVDPTQLSYTDTGLCNLEYCYYVVARNPQGYESRSNRSCTIPDYLMHTTPLLLYRTTVHNDENTLTQWERGEDANLQRYVIDRYAPQAGWEQEYATTTDTFFMDEQALVHEEPYLYKVFMEHVCHEKSPESNPGTSIFLKLQVISDRFFLNWQAYRDFKHGVNRYLVQKQQDDGSFRLIASLPASDTSYSSTDVEMFATESCFRIIAIENVTDQPSISNIACNMLPSRLHIPTAFSPNGDDKNETFRVAGIFLQEATGATDPDVFHFTIYNRWGEELWYTRNIREGWDGTVDGILQPEGVYVFVVRATGLDQQRYYEKGTVTLIR